MRDCERLNCHYLKDNDICIVTGSDRKILTPKNYTGQDVCPQRTSEVSWQRKQEARLSLMKLHPEYFTICEGCKNMDENGGCKFARVLMGPDPSCEMRTK